MITEGTKAAPQKPTQSDERAPLLLDAAARPLTAEDRNGVNGHKSGKYAPPRPDGSDGPGSEVKTDQSEVKTDQSPENKPRASPVRRLIIAAITIAVLAAALIYGLSYYHYAKTHVSTDDASVTGDLVNVGPIISGTLDRLTVQEGDRVHKGQLLARLSDSGALASVRQEQAAYESAMTEIPQARISLAYQQQSTEAAIQKAQAQISAQNAKTAGAEQQVTLSTTTLQDQVVEAQNQVAQSRSQAAQAAAQVAQNQATVKSQRQAVQTAQHAADTDAAKIASYEASQLKADRDEARYAVLVKQDAVTQQKYDSVQATAISAHSDLQSAREQAAESRSRVAGAQADVQQALAQLEAARRNAEAMVQQVAVYRAALSYARSNTRQVGIKQTDVVNNMRQGGQAQADLATALAGRRQTMLKKRQIETYQAQATEAKAALASVQVTEGDTYLYAPTDGQVVRKAVGVGASLSAGQTVVTLTAGSAVWVTANFKETQLTRVRPGQPVEVEVDTLPGKTFQGRIQAIEGATGSSMALLPPDNSTGNFTKVVQRVPVRIQLIPASADADRRYARGTDFANLRQGLSVTATIDTSSDGR